MRHAHNRDEPRRPIEVHPIDCSCCGHDDSALDWNGVAVRVLAGLGLGTAIALTLSAISGVPVL
ncbi:hypothetical protein [Sphingomonas sp.]|uniref:hypothetical protein n=1 Tax=Sphingomonas sp. TaxID=28214 RepID=UPI003F72E736